MSFKEKLKTFLQTKFVKKTCMVFSLIAITSALAFGTIACTPESVQDPPSPPITTPSDDLKPDDGIITPGDETTDPTDPDITDPENPDITDPETPTEPEDPGIIDPEDPDITEPTDPENPDITDPETPVDPEEPEIEDPTPEISFEDLYNEVFGENYEFVPFEDYMQSLAERVFSTSTDVKFLIADVQPDSFTVYADAVVGENRHCLLQGTLKADPYAPIYSPILYNLYDLTRKSEAAGGFKQYMQQVYESCADAGSARAELETISADLDQSIKIASGLARGPFDTTRPATNTTDDIDFSAYAEEYTPEGATPLKAYVGTISPGLLDNAFGTSYTQQFNAGVAYLNDDNTLTVKVITVYVPWYRDSTDEIAYNEFALGEEGKDYLIYERTSATFDAFVLSEELLAQLNPENTL